MFSIKKVAEYFASPDQKNAVLKYFEEKFAQDFEDDYKSGFALSAATVFYNEGLYENALR